MRIEDVTEQMRVVVASNPGNFSPIYVRQEGTVSGFWFSWVMVHLDGMTSSIPFYARELEPVFKAPESHTEPQTPSTLQ